MPPIEAQAAEVEPEDELVVDLVPLNAPNPELFEDYADLEDVDEFEE